MSKEEKKVSGKRWKVGRRDKRRREINKER